MIPKLRKLSRAIFPPYTASKYTWNGSLLRIQCYKGKISPLSRFAVVISKRFYKNTPERNHFKRLVLAQIREKTDYFKGLSFEHYIILPKKPLAEMKVEEICADILGFYEEQKKREISTH